MPGIYSQHATIIQKPKQIVYFQQVHELLVLKIKQSVTE
jgi:hypothetical protein